MSHPDHQCVDQQRRIKLTLEYVDELLDGPLKSGEEMIAKAVRLALTTPPSDSDDESTMEAR